jgi:hypothetical protein
MSTFLSCLSTWFTEDFSWFSNEEYECHLNSCAFYTIEDLQGEHYLMLWNSLLINHNHNGPLISERWLNASTVTLILII